MLTRIPHDADQDLDDVPQVRRGTTAMEYLFMLSLIVVAALVGIGSFGNSTNNLTKHSADSISKAMKK